MEETQVLYQIFSRIAVALGVLNGLTLNEARKLASKQFKKHPFQQEAKALIKKIDKDEHDSIEELFDKIIFLCDELGPSREYVTLVNILENLGNSFTDDHDQNEYKYTNSIIERFEKEVAIINDKIPSPPLFNMVLESRSLIEWSSIYCIYPFIPKRIKGKGRPVLLIPPYLGDDFSKSFVRKYYPKFGGIKKQGFLLPLFASG